MTPNNFNLQRKGQSLPGIFKLSGVKARDRTLSFHKSTELQFGSSQNFLFSFVQYSDEPNSEVFTNRKDVLLTNGHSMSKCH